MQPFRVYGSVLIPLAGSYVCGVCGKKYKYYNCFQTHVRAHRGKALFSMYLLYMKASKHLI